MQIRWYLQYNKDPLKLYSLDLCNKYGIKSLFIYK